MEKINKNFFSLIYFGGKQKTNMTQLHLDHFLLSYPSFSCNCCVKHEYLKQLETGSEYEQHNRHTSFITVTASMTLPWYFSWCCCAVEYG